MSKIINKKQLDFLIESTLKEYNPNIRNLYQGENPHVMRDMVRHNPESASEYDYQLQMSRMGGNKNPNEPSQEDIKSATEYIQYMKDGMCECGAMMYEGICEAGCGSQMEESDYMEEGDYMEEEDGVSYEKSGLEHPEKADLNKDKKISGYEKKRGGAIEKSMEESDYVGESVKDLAESVTKTFNPSFLTEDMDNFKKLINYRNK